MARPSIWTRNWNRFARTMNRQTRRRYLAHLVGKPMRPYVLPRRCRTPKAQEERA